MLSSLIVGGLFRIWFFSTASFVLEFCHAAVRLCRGLSLLLIALFTLQHNCSKKWCISGYLAMGYSNHIWHTASYNTIQ